MADEFWDLQVVMPTSSGQPADNIVNTFHIRTDSAVFNWSTGHAGITSRFSTFYLALADSLAQSLGGSQMAYIKYYRTTDPSPRVPIYTDSMTFLNTTSDDGPHEVSLCLSWKSDPISGTNPQRLRGRTYIGPFRGLETGYVRPQTSLVTKIKNAAKALVDGIYTEISAGTFLEGLSVRSRAPGMGSYGFSPITAGWVDNEWDTQRRRGQKATTRQTFVRA